MAPLLIVLAATCGFDPPQPNADAAKFVADLKMRAEGIKSVRMKITGKTFIPKEHIAATATEDGNPDVSAKPFDQPYSATMHIDFVTPRMRIETDNPTREPDGTPVTSLRTKTWNAGEIKGTSTLTNLPDRTRGFIQRDSVSMELDFDQEPWLRTIGRLNVYQSKTPLNQPPLFPDPDQLKVIGRISLRNRPCTMFELERNPSAPQVQIVYWVDLDRQSSVMRMEYKQKGKIVVTEDIDYAKHGEFWMAQRWTRRSYRSPERMAQQNERIVSELAVNEPFDQSLTEVSFTPGMRVEREDATLKVRDNGSFEIVKVRQTPEQAKQEVVQRMKEIQDQGRPAWGPRIALGLGIVVVLGLMAWFITRHIRSKSIMEKS